MTNDAQVTELCEEPVVVDEVASFMGGGDSVIPGEQAAVATAPNEERPAADPAGEMRMELPRESGLRVFGTLFPARLAGALAAIGATNELSAGEAAGPLEGDALWLTVPYGVYAHPRGTQVVDGESAEAMARRFGQVWSRLARRFHGLPVYVGHPDARGRTPEEQAELAREYPDSTVYGWIEAVTAGDEGLRLLLRWEEAGREMMRRGEYGYFSPHWGMLPITGRPGLYRPVELYSIGLTNHPNIPGLRLRDWDRERAESAVNEEALPVSLAAVNVVEHTQAAADEAEQLRAALNEERQARGRLVVERALEEGRIPPVAREQWLRNLELDFVGNERLLNSLPAAWNTSLRSNPVRGLGGQRGALCLGLADLSTAGNAAPGHKRPDRVERIAREVARRQKEARETALDTRSTASAAAAAGFHEIYQSVKRDHPEWFAEQ